MRKANNWRGYRMSCLATLALLLFSCHLREENDTPKSSGPKVVEAHGYIVPSDSMAAPKVIAFNENKLLKVPAGKPITVPVSSNVHKAGKPKAVIAGTPRIYTPGQGSFKTPFTVPVIDSPFIAGIPEIVQVKDPAVKDQNPQNFSYLSKLHGLKNASIRCMIQDQFGNIWLGTQQGGVSKYDGKTFTHFTADQGLSSNRVFNILEDKDGNLWFGTQGGGVTRYDGINFTHFNTNTGLLSNDVGSLLEDQSGNLWLASQGGLTKYDGKTFTHFTTAQGLPDNRITCLLEDKVGNLWFGMEGEGVCKFDGKSFIHFTTTEGLSHNDVSCIAEDNKGNIWFGTWGAGICKYDSKMFTHFTESEGLSDNNIMKIMEDQFGNLWCGTWGKGVNKYDGKTFTHYTESEGLSENYIVSILEDRSGNLWFGTDGLGVNRYNGNTFTYFPETEGTYNYFVSSILEDASGILWFGSDGGGLSSYDGQSFTHYSIPEGESDNFVRDVAIDSSGNIWFSQTGSRGIRKYDGKTFTHFTKKQGFIDDGVISIMTDHSGILWFGTTSNGVYKYDGNTLTQFTTAEGLSNNAIRLILEDRKGNLWFGTHGGGVTRYDGNTFTHFTNSGGLLGSIILAMVEDQSGHLWFCTESGVSRYDGKSFTHFTTTEGLPTNLIVSILEDRDGNLWFGSPLGLSVLTRNKIDKINAPLNTKPITDHEVYFKNYTYEDGFIGTGCNQNSLFEDRTGTIWIGANNKLTTYHPPTAEEKPDTHRLNIQLTAIALYNERIAWPILDQHKDTALILGNGVKVKDFRFKGTSKWYTLPRDLSLAYRNNFVTFNFIGITMNQSSKVQYQYKMDGLDENWSALSTRNEAPYGNLPYGKYTFNVKAMDSAGNWSDVFHYPFTIRPPWWLSWWAYSLYAVALANLILRLNSFLKARTLRIERERTLKKELEQAKEIEHAYAELKSTQKQLIHAEKMASLGELTAGIAHEIQNPLNFVNNFSDVNKELLVEMKEEIDKGNFIEVGALAIDILTNEEKINHHGKRADAIVKGMLQHSRTNSGSKEQTDINTLADEYLRLAYHGLRAKDNSFNATLQTDFDPSIGKINIIPQDIGRVILNLITNAFYAVSTSAPKSPKGDLPYAPTVTVSTKILLPPSGGAGANRGSWVSISVSDNGPGIPRNILDKIFQPFFTTKPTGQGTGLGLSLSYDIIKAHGGELSVETKEGEGSIFTIQLPVS